MPVMEEDFLLGTIHTIMQDIMNTVSGQFIEFNGDNGQYYLDLKKDIDYDKKIQEKADFLGDDALDRHFFDIMVSTLNYQDTDKYVPGFNKPVLIMPGLTLLQRIPFMADSNATFFMNT